MAINKKLISIATQAQFDAQLSAGNIDNRSIVFIENEKRIWTHGVYFDTSWDYITGTPDTYTPSAHTLASHSDVTITSNSTGEILKWNGSRWINNTLAEAGIASTGQLNNYLPLAGGTMSGLITSNTINTEAGFYKSSNTGTAFARIGASTHDKGFGVSNTGEFIFGDWSGVSSLSTNWNKVWHSGNITPVPTARTITAGNGLTGGGNLSANRTLTLGTPSDITATSTNSVTTTSHTHKLLMGSGSGLDADLLDGLHSKSFLPFSIYNFANGCLVQTDIPASASAMCTVYITGNGYPGVINTQATFYSYNNASIIQHSAIHYGKDFGNINVFVYNGYVCLWFVQTGSFHSYQVVVNYTNATNYGNRVTSITDATMPVGAERTVTIVPGDVALTTSNVASATKLQTARAINGTSFDGTADITTARWGTARNIGVVNSDGTGTAVTTSVNGSANINLRLPSTIKAALTGNASSASAVLTSAENTGTTSRFILFANSASGNQALKTDSGLKYVPSTNTISATFSGDLTGNVTGNVSGSAGSTANWAGNTYANSNITNEVYLMTSTNGTAWRRTLANRYVDTTSNQSIAGIKDFTNNVTAPSFVGSISTPSGVEYLSTLRTAITAAGWYRVFVSNIANSGGSSVILNVNRSYSNTNNESYSFSINVAYNGAISITQLSGRANSRIISKIRVDYVNSGVLAVDIYYSSATSNTVYISGSGTGQFQAPALVAAPTGTTVEFDTVNGVKSNLGFTGDLTGNASSATLASTLTINSSASASWFDILWNSGTTVYGSTGSKLRVQPSTGSITSSGTITASGGNSSQWNSAYAWGSHSGLYTLRGEYRNFGSITLSSATGSTEDFIARLTTIGFFNYSHSVGKASWSYAGNQDITDTGFGTIETAGAVIETYKDGSTKTIKITCANTGGSTPYRVFVYNDQGPTYSPGWREMLTNKTPTVTNWNTAYNYSQVGHLPLSGGTLTGALAINLGASASSTLSLTSAGVTTTIGSLNSTWFHLDTNSTSGFYFYKAITTPSTVTASSFIGNASTATNLSNILTSFTGTYPVTFNVNGTIYSHTGITYTGSTNTLTTTNFVGALSGTVSATTGSFSDTLRLTKNTPSGTGYSALAMEVRSTGGHPVGIGFHRSGSSQTILSHEGSGLVVRSSTISTGALAPITASTFVGALSGNASSASTVALTADNTTNATRYPLFVDAATGNKSPRTDTGFTYNPSTGILTSTRFAGSASASNLDTGTVPDARLSGIYTGFSHKINGTNTLFTSPSSGSDSRGRTTFGLAEYRAHSSAATGAIVFIAPFSRASGIMKSIEIDGMIYSASNIIRIIINNYTTGLTKKMSYGTRDIAVRVGETADGKFCVILGDVASTWYYPHFTLSKAMFSHTAVADTSCYGWSTKLETDLTGYLNVYGEIANSPIVTDITGNAATATALTTSAGSATRPVYFSGGKPVQGTYSLGKSVPSNAVFTDTHWTSGIRVGASGTAANTAVTSPYIKVVDNESYREQFRLIGGSNVTITSDASKNITIAAVNTDTTYSNFTRTVSGLVPAPGLATTTRYLREDGGWVVPPNTPDTHWTTGIRAGASGTTTNSAVTNPYIKVRDNSTHREQIRLIGGTNASVSSDASGNVTISGTDEAVKQSIASNNVFRPVLFGKATGSDAPGSAYTYTTITGETHYSLGLRVNMGNGDVISSGTVTSSGFYQTSDIRLKNVIRNMSISRQDIESIPTFYFTYKDKDKERINIGTSAQEVQKVFPEIVSTDLKGMLSVEYDKFGLIALELIKTQQKEIDSLKYELNNLKLKIDGYRN